ncbi:MAG: hypothetical protein ABSC06_38530 [Rhodopila sp.]|jgi:hypothetical protein
MHDQRRVDQGGAIEQGVIKEGGRGGARASENVEMQRPSAPVMCRHRTEPLPFLPDSDVASDICAW